VVKEWLTNTNPSLIVEPVYYDSGKLFRASRFIEENLDLVPGSLGEEKNITPTPGDILFLLDASWSIYYDYKPIIQEVRQLGGKVVTAVYDLIPIYYPQFCDESTKRAFPKWIPAICRESDEIICISKAVADDLKKYIQETQIPTDRLMDIDYFHLGADIPIASTESTVRKEVSDLVRHKKTSIFLSVGTVEPRKGHAFILDAFESLWQQGDNSTLVFVGKIGWNISKLESRIRNHPQLGKNFFFVEKATDAELDILYSNANALIAASCTEGYGLPIVEAALQHLPVIASDIPVFREVGGNAALYFSLNSQSELRNAVKKVENLPSEDRKKLADSVKVLTWKESADWLLDLALGKRP